VALASVRKGDLVYADPPYTVRHDSNGFRRYNETLFSWEDQERLAATLTRLAHDGATVIVSNAHHSTLRRLYRDFSLKTVRRPSTVASRSEWRTEAKEAIFFSSE
jgi:DNA adenine methylase